MLPNSLWVILHANTLYAHSHSVTHGGPKSFVNFKRDIHIYNIF